MSDLKNASQLAALAELAEHLNVLESEVRHVTRRAKALLEECWMVRHTEIYPKLCEWKEATAGTSFLTFSVKKATLQFEQLLSSQSLGTSQENFQPLTSPDIFNSAFSHLGWAGQDVSPLVSLALAGHEMQFNFEHKFTVLPLSFFDQVVGFIVAEVPTLKIEDYDNVISESTALLSSLRRVVMSGKLSYLQTMSRAS